MCARVCVCVLMCSTHEGLKRMADPPKVAVTSGLPNMLGIEQMFLTAKSFL